MIKVTFFNINKKFNFVTAASLNYFSFSFIIVNLFVRRKAIFIPIIKLLKMRILRKIRKSFF